MIDIKVTYSKVVQLPPIPMDKDLPIFTILRIRYTDFQYNPIPMAVSK